MIGRLTSTLPLCVLLLSQAATPAQAQMGTSANPPPQNLFKFDDSPKRLDDGLGTMAERRRVLAASKRAHPVTQPRPRGPLNPR